MARTGYERLDLDRIVGMFGRYLELSDRAISRAQARSACSPSSLTRRFGSTYVRCCRQPGRRL